MIFVEKYRSKQKKPPLPDPKFHPDDEDDGTVTFVSNTESVDVEESAVVKFWCEKWRLVVGKILERDIELVSPKTSPINSGTENDKEEKEQFAFIQLTDDEYRTLKEKCLESLSHSHGRTAFSLIINRQRNTEYGLELQREQFLGLADLIYLFLDAIQKSNPLDIKPAKLVMIMSQSLWVKKNKMEQEKEENDNDQKEENEETEKESNHFSKNDKLFIVDRIKNHELWKNDKFWKEAYCDSVQQEILKYPAVKKWHSEQEQNEAERREEQIIFSQLAAWTHNMKEFGTDNQKILKFLDSRGLKKEQVNVLKATLGLNENIESPEIIQTFETVTGSTSPDSPNGLP